MRIVSFGWTSDALIARQKTVTRRNWNGEFAGSFDKGQRIAAWDKSPRTGKGHQIAVIELTEDPLLSNRFPDEDYEAEGLAWMDKQGLRLNGVTPCEFWARWQREKPFLWVVRFRVLEVTP